MKWRVLGQHMLALGGLASACGGDASSKGGVMCGAGTVLEGDECVAGGAQNVGGGGSPGSSDSGGSKTGGAGQIGGTTAQAGEESGPGGSGEPSSGGVPSGGGQPAEAGAPSGGVPEQMGGAGGEPHLGGAPSDGGLPGTGGGGGSDGIERSSGCGKTFAGTSGAKVTIQTSGVKDADCAARLNGQPKCGAWSTPRDYYVYLPDDYDPNHPYNLVFLGPGCGLNGSQIYELDNNVNGTAIRIGLTPGPNSLGHATNPNQGCFDDKEGDDSIDFVFYETLYDKLEGELCFDRERVYAGGNSTGAFLANELGCKYAGDALRPIRGVVVNNGGLPTDPRFVPTCTSNPMAGMWVHEVDNQVNLFAGNIVAIDRAMDVNGCAAASYDTATFEDYPIGGNNADSTCKKIVDCSELYPLVVCALPGSGQGTHPSIVDPGFATFITNMPAL